MLHGSPFVMDMAKERQQDLLELSPAFSGTALGSLRRRSGELLIAAGLKLLGQPVATANQGPTATPA